MQVTWKLVMTRPGLLCMHLQDPYANSFKPRWRSVEVCGVGFPLCMALSFLAHQSSVETLPDVPRITCRHQLDGLALGKAHSGLRV